MIKKLALIAFIFLFKQEIYATKIKASTFSTGYNATDVTTVFKAAIQASFDTVVIDFVGSGEWIVQPCTFTDLSNRTIIFEPNVQLIAKLGAFTDPDDCLFRLIRANNVIILGYGATFKMQKSEYTGEYRHALSIANCNAITIKGLTLKDSGGDGIFITGETYYGTQLYSENIIIKDCVCDNHRRQGMSVISAQNLTVENCIFKNTIGTLPEAGLDLEPSEPFHRIVNCVFKNCQFKNNNGKGIELAFTYLNATSIPVSATFNDCYTTSNYQLTNAYDPGEISATGHPLNFPTGNVTFNNLLVENSQWTAFRCRKQADSYSVVFNNSRFKNVSQNTRLYNNPIWIEVVDYFVPTTSFGGVVFDNVCVDFTTNMAALVFYGETNATGLKNVTGNLGIVNTYQLPPVYRNINAQSNVNFTTAIGCATVLSVQYLKPLSGQYLGENILLQWATYNEQNNAYFEVERSKNGLDFEKIGEMKGKNGNNRSQNYTFVDKNATEGQNYYRLKQVDYNEKFTHSNIIVVAKKREINLKIYPNPTSGMLYISKSFLNNDSTGFTLFNSLGRVILQDNYMPEMIDLNDLKNGIYLLKVGNEVVKIVKE